MHQSIATRSESFDTAAYVLEQGTFTFISVSSMLAAAAARNALSGLALAGRHSLVLGAVWTLGAELARGGRSSGSVWDSLGRDLPKYFFTGLSMGFAAKSAGFLGARFGSMFAAQSLSPLLSARLSGALSGASSGILVSQSQRLLGQLSSSSYRVEHSFGVRDVLVNAVLGSVGGWVGARHSFSTTALEGIACRSREVFFDIGAGVWAVKARGVELNSRNFAEEFAVAFSAQLGGCIGGRASLGGGVRSRVDSNRGLPQALATCGAFGGRGSHEVAGGFFGRFAIHSEAGDSARGYAGPEGTSNSESSRTRGSEDVAAYWSQLLTETDAGGKVYA